MTTMYAGRAGSKLSRCDLTHMAVWGQGAAGKQRAYMQANLRPGHISSLIIKVITVLTTHVLIITLNVDVNGHGHFTALGTYIYQMESPTDGRAR